MNGEALAAFKGSTPNPLPSCGERLTDEALRRIAILASKVRLVHAPAQFPHVINRIAALWAYPDRMLGHFNQLLLDEREKGRSGFPFAVANELAELQSYYESRYFPAKSGWQDAVPNRDIIGRAVRRPAGTMPRR